MGNGTRDGKLISTIRRLLGAGSVTAAELPVGVAFEPSRFAEDAPEHIGLFIGLFLDPVAAAELAIEGGEPTEMLHVTIGYIADANLDERRLAGVIASIDDTCSWLAPVSGRVAGYGRFLAGDTSDGKDVFHAIPDVVGLAELRENLLEPLSWRGIDFNRGAHGWAPHITLAYLDSGTANPVETLPETVLRFDTVTIAYGERMVQIPLRGADSSYVYGGTVVGQGEKGARLFTEVAFAEPPATVPVLPQPGTYQHAVYGRIELTPERIERFVANHNERIYQDQVPIDAEHETKLSGAVGYIGDLFINGDGSASANVEWTDRGRSLIEGDGYKYVSPEWFDYWQDPAPGGEAYEDVLIGLAITTRPFFKDGSLGRLVASEDASASGLAATPASDSGSPAEAGTGEETVSNTSQAATAVPGGVTAAEATPVQMSEAQIKAVEDRVAARFAEQISAKDAQITQLSERVDKQEADARNKRFAAEVGGHVEGGVRWIGKAADKVAYLEKLATAFGEDSDEVKDYIAENRTHAEQMRKSELFKEFGGDGDGAGSQSAWDQIEAKAREINTSKPTLTFAEATAQAIRENPELHRQYREERNKK